MLEMNGDLFLFFSNLRNLASIKITKIYRLRASTYGWYIKDVIIRKV